MPVRHRTSEQFNGVPMSSAWTLTPVDATIKAGALKFTHAVQSWVVDSNALWGSSSQPVPRYNKSVVRWPAKWTSPLISFNAQCTTKTNSDMAFSVMVDGAYVTNVVVAGDTVNRRIDVTNLPIAAGGSTVEVWEPVNGRPANNNNGSDGQWEGGVVTGVYLPQGISITKPTATTGIIAIGTSIVSCAVDGSGVIVPEVAVGWLGHIRLLAQAQGWLVASRDVGATTLCGEGFTAAQLATDLTSLATQMGLTTVYLWCGDLRNDWSYYALNGVNTTPTQAATFLQAVITAVPAAWNKVVFQPLPQLSEAANSGGFTLGAYRTAITAGVSGTNVTIVDTSTWGLNTTTDYGDGVHLNTSGVTKAVAGSRGSFGL